MSSTQPKIRANKAQTSPARPAIRRARPEDISRLMEIETTAFTSDRLSRQSMKRLIEKRESCDILCATEKGLITGYVATLFRRNSSMGRVYSLAVDNAWRGRGIGRLLLDAAEERITRRGDAFSRLELRAGDTTLLKFYAAAGYRQFGQRENYYEDGCAALRMEKRLAPSNPPAPVPFYAQTLDFTCGPAALLIALHALDPAFMPSQREELAIWREATTIFMAAGHGGCGPHGLALAARARGFQAEIYLSDDTPLFIDSVRDKKKKEVLKIVHHDFAERCRENGIPVHKQPLTANRVQALLKQGAMPIVLISSYRFYRTKEPHWVAVTGADKRFIYSHDPYIDSESERNDFDGMNIPVDRKIFERMARFGKRQLRAAVIIRKA